MKVMISMEIIVAEFSGESREKNEGIAAHNGEKEQSSGK
jgi:hypothetical protein